MALSALITFSILIHRTFSKFYYSMNFSAGCHPYASACTLSLLSLTISGRALPSLLLAFLEHVPCRWRLFCVRQDLSILVVCARHFCYMPYSSCFCMLSTLYFPSVEFLVVNPTCVAEGYHCLLHCTTRFGRLAGPHPSV